MIKKIALTATLILMLSLTGSASDAEQPTLTLFFTGFVSGNFGPCGCNVNPSGGLARRAGYAHKYVEETGHKVLHIDLGNYFMPLGPDSRRVNETMLDSLRTLPIQVLNLTPSDLFLWRELNQAADLKEKVISTNLRPKDMSTAAPQRYKVIDISGDELGLKKALKIGFLGISDPTLIKPNSGFVALDPVQAIADLFPEISSKADFWIVLSDIARAPGKLPQDSVAHRIALAHRQIFGILTTEGQYILHKPEMVNNAVILSSVERGRHLGQLELELDSEGKVVGVKPDFIELKAGTPEDPKLLQQEQQLNARLGR